MPTPKQQSETRPRNPSRSTGFCRKGTHANNEAATRESTQAIRAVQTACVGDASMHDAFRHDVKRSSPPKADKRRKPLSALVYRQFGASEIVPQRRLGTTRRNLLIPIFHQRDQHELLELVGKSLGHSIGIADALGITHQSEMHAAVIA